MSSCALGHCCGVIGRLGSSLGGLRLILFLLLHEQDINMLLYSGIVSKIKWLRWHLQMSSSSENRILTSSQNLGTSQWIKKCKEKEKTKHYLAKSIECNQSTAKPIASIFRIGQHSNTTTQSQSARMAVTTAETAAISDFLAFFFSSNLLEVTFGFKLKTFVQSKR